MGHSSGGPFVDRFGFGAILAVDAVLLLGVVSLSFNILSSSTTNETRARVMTFAYLPLNLGFVLGPLLGSFVASTDPFAIFPLAVVLALTGLGLVALALRRPLA